MTVLDQGARLQVTAAPPPATQQMLALRQIDTIEAGAQAHRQQHTVPVRPWSAAELPPGIVGQRQSASGSARRLHLRTRRRDSAPGTRRCGSHIEEAFGLQMQVLLENLGPGLGGKSEGFFDNTSTFVRSYNPLLDKEFPQMQRHQHRFFQTFWTTTAMPNKARKRRTGPPAPRHMSKLPN